MNTIFRICALSLFIASPSVSTASYSIQTYFDTSSGNTETRVYYGGFHFGSFLSTANGAQVFRPHPDQSGPDSWGTSLYLIPFIAGADPRLGSFSITSDANGIDYSIIGVVARGAADSYGTYSLVGQMSYDSASAKIQSQGNLSIHLSGLLDQAGGDLNLNRIATNFLHNVPRQPPVGGLGDTGDVSQIRYYFDASMQTGDTWNPVSQPGHFPQLTSPFVGFDLIGELNTVDVVAMGLTDTQIHVADKPNVRLEYFTETGQALLSAGMFFDLSQAQNPYADNVGLNQLILKNFNGNLTNIELKYNFESAPHLVPLPPAALLFSVGLLAIIGFRRPSVSVSV